MGNREAKDRTFEIRVGLVTVGGLSKIFVMTRHKGKQTHTSSTELNRMVAEDAMELIESDVLEAVKERMKQL